MLKEISKEKKLLTSLINIKQMYKTNKRRAIQYMLISTNYKLITNVPK